MAYTFLSTSIFSVQSLAKLGALWLAYKSTIYLYRLSHFHPLAKFPGPRLAAATWLYEFWYDFCLGGQYTNKIGRLHEQYGPIVRINPNELHCLDPALLNDIYGRPGKARERDTHFLNFILGEQLLATAGTRNHEFHRIRRAPLNPFFSRARVLKLEDPLQGYIDRFCDKMIANPTKGQPFDLAGAFACFTVDMVTEYVFGEPLGHLSAEAWSPNFRELFDSVIRTCYLFRFFAPLRWLGNIALHLRPVMTGQGRILLDEMYVHMPNRIKKVMADREAGIKHQDTTVFAELLDSKLPPSEKTVKRLAAEGFSLTTAGTDTTATTLAVITFYLLHNVEIYHKLMDELNSIPDPLQASWSTLETLPYLYGVIHEGLRLSVNVSIRTPRSSPDEEIVYNNTWRGKAYSYVVPRGTPIGASTALNHLNPDVYPDPEEFIPGRWFHPDGSRNRDPEIALTAFSRGVTMCLGRNLAMCELFRMTVAVALRIIPAGLKLYETGMADVKYDHCMIMARPKVGSHFVRVTMPTRV